MYCANIVVPYGIMWPVTRWTSTVYCSVCVFTTGLLWGTHSWHVTMNCVFHCIVFSPVAMANDPLAEAGFHFDELNKLRVLDPEVGDKTSELKEECKEFVDSKDFVPTRITQHIWCLLLRRIGICNVMFFAFVIHRNWAISKDSWRSHRVGRWIGQRSRNRKDEGKRQFRKLAIQVNHLFLRHTISTWHPPYLLISYNAVFCSGYWSKEPVEVCGKTKRCSAATAAGSNSREDHAAWKVNVGSWHQVKTVNNTDHIAE